MKFRKFIMHVVINALVEEAYFMGKHQLVKELIIPCI